MTINVPEVRDTDPAASMALLQSLMSESGFSEYEEAQRLHPERVLDGTLRASFGAALVLALVGLVIGIAISQVRAQAPATVKAKKELVSRINETQSDINSLNKQKAALQSDVETLRQDVLSNSTLGQAYERIINEQKAAAQYTDVSGPGADVTLDNPAPDKIPSGVDPALAQVLDSDVSLAVNGLWKLGATAVSVNGIRLTSTTAIRSAGGSILVSYRPILAPYVVRAVGPKNLAALFSASAAGKQLQQLSDSYGIVYQAAPNASLHLAGSTAGLPDVSDLHVGLAVTAPKAASKKTGGKP